MSKRNSPSKNLVTLEQKPGSPSGFLSFASTNLLAEISIVLSWKQIKFWILAQLRKKAMIDYEYLSRWGRGNESPVPCIFLSWLKYWSCYQLGLNLLLCSFYMLTLGPSHLSHGFKYHLFAGGPFPCPAQLTTVTSRAIFLAVSLTSPLGFAHVSHR